MRIFKLFASLLLLIVFILLTVRFLLLDQLVTMVLQRAGATDISIHISDVSWDHIHIDLLNAAFKLPTGKIIKAKANGLSLHYRPKYLLRAQKFDLLEIGKVAISLSGTKTDSQPFHFPKQIIPINDTLRAALPLEKLHIQKLLLHEGVPEQITNRIIQTDVLIQGTVLSTTTTLQMDTNTVVTLVASSPDASHANIDIVGRRNQTDIFQTKIILQPDGINGSIDAQINPVLNLLPKVLDKSKIQSFKGRLDGAFTIPLPLQDDSNIHAALTLIDTHHRRIDLEVNGIPDKQHMSLLLRAFVNEQEFLNTRLTANQQNVRGDYTVQAGLLLKFISPYSQRPIPKVSGSLTGTLELSLAGNEIKGFATSAMLSSPALFDFNASTAQIHLAGSLDKGTIILNSGSTFSGKNISFANTKIEECNLNLAGTFKRFANQLQLIFAEQQNIQIKGLTTDKIHITGIHLQPEHGLQVNFDHRSWHIRPNLLTIDPLHLKTEAIDINTEPLSCTFSIQKNKDSLPKIIAELATPEAIINNITNKLQLPLKELTGTFQLENNQFSGQIQFSPEIVPGRIEASFTHDLTTTAGIFEVRTDEQIVLNNDEISLKNLVNNIQLPLDLDHGTITFTADGSWKTGRAMQVSASYALSGGSGYYKHNLFEGLDVQQDLIILPQLHSKSEGRFFLRQLIGGIDIHDLASNVKFLPSTAGVLPKIQLDNTSASLLEGIVSSPAISYDFNQPDSNFTVNIKGMDLKSLVDLVNIKELHITGKISGNIPISIKGSAISVNDGQLYNDQPGGEIGYTPKNISNAGLTGYALKAVRDFQYDSLRATALYDPSGQLDLDISLQGISPELDNSRRVHLNIHAEQNLPALLQSLRYSKGLTEELDKKVQQRYK